MRHRSKILIVEDDLPSAALLREILEQSNYDVISTDDGQKSLLFAEKEKPDMAIIDVMLPTLNGFEVCEQIREINSNMPIIMLTVLNETYHRIRAIQAGATDFLTKPFDRLELLAKIRSLLETHRDLEQYELFINMSHCLLTALKYRNPEIAAHSHRVSKLSEEIAGLMQLDSGIIKEIRLGALLHDIGYIALEDNMVKNQDDKQHILIGHEMFSKFNRPIICSIIKSHHEKICGGGFPNEISGCEIDMPVRIVALCNRFDILVNSEINNYSTPETVLLVLRREVKDGYWDSNVMEKLEQNIKMYSFEELYTKKWSPYI